MHDLECAACPQTVGASSRRPQALSAVLHGVNPSRHDHVMRAPDPALPVVFDRAAALSAGLSDGQVDRRVTNGRWDRLRRGRFTAVPLDEDGRWRAEVVAIVGSHRRTLVLSHHHAARAWRLPRPLAGWGVPTFTARRGPTFANTSCRILTAPLPDEQLVLMGRTLVTSPSRTVLDCARSLPPRDGLAIADAALRAGICSRAELLAVSAAMRGWPGCPKARRIVELADGRRETALESWSAWSFDEHQLPMPAWQVTLCDAAGVFLGRVDGWWSDGVAGEADGRAKYGLAALERGGVGAEGLAGALDDERARERRLRRAGVVVVRWTARDVLDPGAAQALAADLRRQIQRGGRFEGRVMPS
jgi:hypothetical protein